MSLQYPNGVQQQQLTICVFVRWERRLHEDDISVLIRFRKEKFPEVDRHFRDLDFLSARTILDGLVAYGWTYVELSKCRGDLMTQLFRYVDREQLAHGKVQTFAPEPCRKRRRLEQDSTSTELSNRSNADRLHLDAVDFNHEEPMADEDPTDDEEIEDDNSSTTDNSTTSNATSCTSLSTCAQGVYAGQEHPYQAGIEADNLMMTDEPRHPYYLTPAFNDGQSNGMFSCLENLTLS